MTEDQLEQETLGWLSELGVPVQYQKDGETRGNFVRLISGQLRLPEVEAQLEAASQ